MPLVSTDLDTVQTFLRDDGTLWDRTELLRWYSTGYRRLLAESHGVRQLTVLPVPPRHAYNYCYLWERRYLQDAPVRQFVYPSAPERYWCTSLWELEQTGGVEVTGQSSGVTSLWEIAFAHESINTPYRFTLPRHHERIAGLWYDHKPLEPIAVRELDPLETGWTHQQGEPLWWTPGTGETRSVEVYEIAATYQADYAAEQWDQYGAIRTFTGERSYTVFGTVLENGYAYTAQGDSLAIQLEVAFPLSGFGQRITSALTSTYQVTQVWEQEQLTDAASLTAGTTIGTYWWEADHGATNFTEYPTGLIREMTSPDRQYLPSPDWELPLGGIRDLHSSAGNLLLWEVVLPDVPDLTEDDTPVMIPAPLQKYLRYYTLYCAFARQGEGYRPDLAMHWKQRWERGPKLLRKLGDITFADQRHHRQTTRSLGRPQRVSPYAPFPSQYGRVRV